MSTMNSTNDETEDVSAHAHHRQGIHLCDEETKLRLANEIVEAINHCLLDKMTKTVHSTSELSPDGPRAEPINFGESSEHSSASIREFKRLGAYCTLRPEQRRKHLLKALPTLRNSRILKSLLASADSQPNTNDETVSSSSLSNSNRVIDDLLSNLDQIISSEAATKTDSECIGDGRVTADGCVLLDPKIEDCLRELDVYLEEIDRDYAMACTYGSSVRINCNNPSGKVTQRPTMESDESLILLDNMEMPHDDDEYGERSDCNAAIAAATMVGNIGDNDHNDNNGGIDRIVQMQRNFQSDSHMMRTFSSSDTNINQCDTTMNNSLDTDQIGVANGSGSSSSHRRRCADDDDGVCSSSSGSDALKRGHRTRNTIGGSRSTDNGSIKRDGPIRSHQLHRINNDHLRRGTNWRRSSMRKTKPILLPQTDDDILRPESHRIQSNEDDLITCRDGILATDANEMPSDHLPLNDVTPSSSNNTTSTDDGDLRSLNNEFLTTILATPSSSSHHAPATCEESLNETHSTECRTMLNECNVNTEITRPRQMGRRQMRSRIVSITAERNEAGNQRIIVNCDAGQEERISSTTLLQQQQHQQHRRQQLAQHIEPSSQLFNSNESSHSIASELSSGASSRNPSPVSLLSSSESSSADGGNSNAGATTHHRTMNCANDAAIVSSANSNIQSRSNSSSGSNTNNNNNSHNVTSSASSSRRENTSAAMKAYIWPNGFSRVLAALSCSVGLFNISRFAIFSILFGVNFMIQFLILSIFFGIPMMWLQMCLGSHIKRGPISMWRISPICRGIGIALIVVQGVMTVYSAIALAWLLVFIRDSCVTSRYPWYRWQEVNEFFRGPSDDGIAIMSNTSEPSLSSVKLGETVADYFNGIVLERFQLGPTAGGRSGLGGVRFQMAFNVTVLWFIVFVVLCKGLRSYGKIVFALTVLPMLGLTAMCIKLLTMLRLSSVQNIFASSNWSDFFINSQSWMSAAQETFLTWSLLGASLISIFSRTSGLPAHTIKTFLRRDALIVVIMTLFVLFLAAFLGNACVQLLNDKGFYYFPGSFETISSSVFLLPSNKPLSPQLATSLSKWLPRYSTLLGESYRHHDPHSSESGWQAIRLATELFPATVAAATNAQMSSLWTLLGFGVFLLFGIGQLVVMWQPIAEALGNNTRSLSTLSTTTLLSCLIGCFLGVPLVTESAINIIYFLDTTIGGAWFVLLLWTVQIFAIFLVRGRPYSADKLVTDLRFTQSVSAFIALSWNLMIPIGLLTLCVLEYKLSSSHDFYRWTSAHANAYWPIWARKLAAGIQIGIFQIVPLTAIFQSYRYLSKGPPDILERFQSLYRPLIGASPVRRPGNMRQGERIASRPSSDTRQTANVTISPEHVSLDSGAASLTIDDPPPKYTPPPSYTAVTGSRIAKLLRNSIRRSVRRIMGEPSSSCNNRRPTLSQVYANTMESSIDDHQLPPSYSTVSRTQPSNVITLNTTNELNARSDGRQIDRQQSIDSHRRHTTTTFPSIEKIEKYDSFSSTIPRRPAPTPPNQIHLTNSYLTAQDVARLLRSTAPFEFAVQTPSAPPVNEIANDNNEEHRTDSDNDAMKLDEQENYSLTQSIEHLVLNEMPIGESTAVAVAYMNDVERNQSNDDCTH